MQLEAVSDPAQINDSLLLDSEWELNQMFGTIRRKGFCRGCIQNIQQVRRIESRPLRILDSITLRATALLNLGPWYCTYCGTSSLYLRSPIYGMRDFEADKNRDAKAADELPVGNFISRENSLLAASENTDRFSKKYRDGIVVKLLKGQSTMAQMCSEINVTERDLMNWVRNYVDDQQQMMAEEIQQLKYFISEANQNTLSLNYREQLEDTVRQHEHPDSFPDGHSRTVDIVEGQVRPGVE